MGMLYQRNEVFWIKYRSSERPIRQSSGTCLPSCKMHRAKWLAGTIPRTVPTPRLTLPL
jgi:hypothetical protein